VRGFRLKGFAITILVCFVANWVYALPSSFVFVKWLFFGGSALIFFCFELLTFLNRYEFKVSFRKRKGEWC